ncbi:MAG: lysophospholipase [Pseudanabaena sp.]|nr:MAG: lysophospholipase [Pseudanabaena sp.]
MPDGNQPKLIIFSQHGMSDTNRTMNYLAHQVAPLHSHIVAPNLGFIQTHFEIESLILKVERSAAQAFELYSDIPARIIATSLGGVIWVEVLSRHQEWWSKIESLVLLGSPIGGADLARIIDPFGWGIGIAKHLGKNRRPLAEQITAVVPTLVVAGNIGSDGLVTTESTKLKHAHFVCLDGVSHPDLRFDPKVVGAIQEFWSKTRKPLPPPKATLTLELIEHFRSVPGITDANSQDFCHAKTVFSFADGTSICTWKNIFGVDHVFITNGNGECEYAGFVGWVDSAGMKKAISQATKSY